MIEQLNNPVVTYIVKVIMAFLVGALIGLERERTRILYTKSQKEQKFFALPGIRSFGLLSLYGMMLAYIPSIMINTLLQAVIEVFLILLIYTVFTVYIYRRTIMARTTGITTYLVMSISIILGYLVGLDKMLEAIATSMLVTLVLAIKPSITRFVRGITYNELLSGLELGLFVFVLGPFFIVLRPSIYGIDLSSFYILFVVILGLSYISYIAVKIKGSEALRYIAFLGGLVNSEAAASNIAAIISEQENLSDRDKEKFMQIYLSIIIIAMIIRNIIIAVILAIPLYNPINLIKMTGILASLLLIPLIVGFKGLFYREEQRISAINVMIENPLSYSTALKVVVAYSAIFIISIITSMMLPPEFLVFIAFIGGLVNAGATILSLITITQLESLEFTFLLILILMTNIGASVNKLLFVRMVTHDKNIISATVKTIFYVIVSSLIPILLIFTLTG